MIDDNTPDAIATAQHLVALSEAAICPYEPEGYSQYAHVILPEGCKLQDISAALEKTQDTPNRKSGTVKLKSLDSLIAYAKEQAATATGYLYADPDSCTISAVFNDARGSAPGWRDHRAVLKFEHTPEFIKWKGNDRQPKEQGAFAEFIEDNMADIKPEDATTLLAVATTIQATSGITFSSAKRLQNGQNQLVYSETIDATAGKVGEGAITIPQTFELALRVFKNAEPWQFKARLKYRLHAGGVKFFYELDRPERVVEAAFKDYVEKVKEAGYTVLVGSPD